MLAKPALPQDPALLFLQRSLRLCLCEWKNRSFATLPFIHGRRRRAGGEEVLAQESHFAGTVHVSGFRLKREKISTQKRNCFDVGGGELQLLSEAPGAGSPKRAPTEPT